jgi:hypothetical protein
VAAAPLFPATTGLPPLPPDAAPDPVIPLWQEWQRLHTRATRLCHRWQEIETRLMRTIGFPVATQALPDGPDGVAVEADPAVDNATAAHQARWRAAAERLGFDDAKRRESEAWDEEAAAGRAVFGTRATSLAGVEIKIALMVRLCSAGSDDPDFPLPQLRATLADVKRLRRAL